MGMLEEFFEEKQELYSPDSYNIGITFYLNSECNRGLSESHEWDAPYILEDESFVNLPRPIVKMMESDEKVNGILETIMTETEEMILEDDGDSLVFYKHMPVAKMNLVLENGQYYINSELIPARIGQALEIEIQKRIQ